MEIRPVVPYAVRREQVRRYIVSYKKASGWTVVYDGRSWPDAARAEAHEIAKGRTLVCMNAAPHA